MQKEPSSSSLSSTAPMQEPTQDSQNELMDSPMEMGAQEQREQRKVLLNETLSSEMSWRPEVKARSAHPSTSAPMMEKWGSTVLLDQHHPARTRRQQAICTRLRESTLRQLLSQRRMCGSSRGRKRAGERFSFKTENRNQS